MCTFDHETAVTFCYVAIGRVWSNLEEAYPGALEPARIAAILRRAIAQAQLVSGSDPATPR